MEEALRARLLGMAGLTALVGTRIDWGVRSQGAELPAVELHLISEPRPMNMASPGVWADARVQVNCWGRTFKAARDVANVIGAKAAQGGLHGWRATFEGIRFRIFVIDRASDSDTDSAGVVHRTRLDLNIWWAPIS